MLKKIIATTLLLVLTLNSTAFSATAPDIDAKASLLMEASTGKILSQQNSDTALPPASVTKVMTLILIFDALPYIMEKLSGQIMSLYLSMLLVWVVLKFFLSQMKYKL